MSLLTTASVWTTDDIPKTDTVPKKRNTTIRRNRYENNVQEPEDYKRNSSLKNIQSGDDYIQSSTLTTLQPENINQHIENNEKREFRINEILNQMDQATDVNMNDNARRLSDFNPPPKPQSFVKSDNVSILGTSDSTDTNYSNYQTTYSHPSSISQQPYYSKMGLSNSSNSLNDNKIMDKINYMIHMLEEQQNEKTANVTEEFILYTFLGVFIIFISDSFARSGKYTR